MHVVILLVHVVHCLNLGRSAPSSPMSHKPARLSGTDVSLKAPLTWGPPAHPDHHQDNLVWTAGESDDVKKKRERPLKSQLLSEGLFKYWSPL